MTEMNKYAELEGKKVRFVPCNRIKEQGKVFVTGKVVGIGKQERFMVVEYPTKSGRTLKECLWLPFCAKFVIK